MLSHAITCLNKMPYRRRYTSYRARRRTVRSGQRYRSTARTRPYRMYRRNLRTIRKRTMTKRKILNITSRKKRDTMLPFSGITPTQANGTPVAGAAVMNGSFGTYIIGWIATARDQTQSSTLPQGSVGDEATRTATTCYMRGLKESIQVQTSSGVAWEWRRICFKYRGSAVVSDQVANNLFLENSNGWVRATNILSQNTGVLQSLLFKGSQGVDWQDFFTAPVDTRRVDLAYDKRTIIESGNANGLIRTYSRWHPMNKNLVYNDDENGGDEFTPVVSVSDKRGMGDYYVIDIIRAASGATSSDQMSFAPEATLYWHEK